MRLRSLDAVRAARCEQLVRDVLALLDDTATVATMRRDYVTQTHKSGLMPGVDPTKLGQRADEI